MPYAPVLRKMDSAAALFTTCGFGPVTNQHFSQYVLSSCIKRRFLTCNQARPELEARKVGRQERRARHPVPVPAKLVVHTREQRGAKARIHRLSTVARREREARGHRQPAQCACGRERDATRCERTIGFVELVFFWVEDLVPEVELQAVHPDPEDDVCELREGVGAELERGSCR